MTLNEQFWKKPNIFSLKLGVPKHEHLPDFEELIIL